MKRIVRYGMLLLIVSVICLLLLGLNAQNTYAYEEETLQQDARTAEKAAAIKAAHEAIEALPPFPEITEAHRPAVEEARRLTDIAIEEYGANWWEMCIRRALLEMIEVKMEKFIDEEALPGEERPLPPTGGLPTLAVLGTMLTGTGVLMAKFSKKR